ncbi:sensor histidine kinase [uncultured Pseudokineococcus sp.]|uniref:sensor histidine kinase n=1 Tax=uncultured Pseudokineococcus sp. TaxID=1642928 RepID=UPI0026054D5F|nr:histidine kinase [uncultured Pseudokineococcus sp.]
MTGQRAGAAPTPDVSRGRLDDRLERRGIGTVLGRDALLAALVAVGTAVVTLLLPVLVPPDLLDAEAAARLGERTWWLALVAAAQAAALCLRRVALGWCLVLVVAGQVLLVAAAPDETLRGVAPAVAWYTAGVLLPARRAGALLLAALAAETAAAAAAAAAAGGGVLVTALLTALGGAASGAPAIAVGLHVATRRRYLALLRAEAAALADQQQERVRTAVAAERSRLARELHDVAAHHLSGMVVQAAAVERLVDRDPAAARQGAAWLRSQGKETLENLRQAVGLLRGSAEDLPDAGAAARAPLPGLASLDDLLAQAREAGDEVRVERPEHLPELPPLADASVYRVAQQALTNARQHAPGAPVLLRLEVEGAALLLEVVNGAVPAPASAGGRGALAPSPPGGGGTGLAVMRERAALVGGQLHAGRTDEGGWRVVLRVRVPSGPADELRDPGRPADGGGGGAA